VIIAIRFSEPIPRKGTETRSILPISSTSPDSCFSEPIPRKGTETPRKIRELLSIIFEHCFSEPIPRKGTETLPQLLPMTVTQHEVFQNLFPARGRKLLCSLLLLNYCHLLSFSEPIPRKGTETVLNPTQLPPLSSHSFFRTYSPQGDGNGFFQDLLLRP